MEQTIDYKGYKIEVWRDNYAESPREWDNVGTIYSNHRSYNPDKHSIDEIYNCSDWQNDDDCEFNEEKFAKDNYYLKVYAYIHSGISLSCSRDKYPFNDRWDSGLFGIIAVNKLDCKKDINPMNDGETEEDYKERIESCLKDEIETLNMVYNDEVYGITVTDPDGDDVVSIGGYYGDKEMELEIYGYKRWIDTALKEREAERNQIIVEINDLVYNFSNLSFPEYIDCQKGIVLKPVQTKWEGYIEMRKADIKNGRIGEYDAPFDISTLPTWQLKEIRNILK